MADLSLAKQCDIILKAEQVWADSQGQTEMYAAEAETIKALAEQQAGRTQILSQINNVDMEDDKVRVVWMDMCEDELDDSCQDVCDFSGTDKALAYKDYTLTGCVSASFSVDENDLLRTAYSQEEYTARQLLSKKKLLDEKINRDALLFLSASAGYNKNQSNPAGVWSPNTMTVDASKYNEDLLVKMAVDAKINRISDAFLVDSGALWEPFLRAELGKNDCCGKGAEAKSKLFKTYFDLVGFPTAPVTDTSFLISPASYAFGHRNYNPAEPIVVNPKSGWQQRFSVPSDNIPGLRYDVYYQYECSGNRFKHSYLIVAKYGFFLNPEGCPDADDNVVSGILSYTKATPTT